MNKNKRAQEEIVGFAIIIIIVAVVLLLFLGFYINSGKKESVESYEANSFIQAFLPYTTECRDYLEYFSIRKLIFECNDNALCFDDTEACDILNSTLKDIVSESWQIGEDRPIKGYELKIIANQEEILLFAEGNTTGNYKGANQDLAKGADDIEIFFRAYS